MQDLIGWPLVYIFIALFIILSIFLGVRIVPQSEKHVVERFGRLRSVRVGVRWGVSVLALGDDFGQNAILFAESNAAMRLVLCRLGQAAG